MSPIEKWDGLEGRIWALVCGLPSIFQRRRRQLLFLQANVDSSVETGRYLALAGYVAPAEVWAKFSPEWKEVSDMRLRGEPFHMVEVGYHEGSREWLMFLYRVIERHLPVAVSCVVDIGALNKVISERPWDATINPAKELENPYYWAILAIVNVLAQRQTELGIDQPVEWIFDNQAEKVRAIEAWDSLKRGMPPEYRRLVHGAPQYKDDADWPPLQAADFYAWWVRKWALQGIHDLQQLPFPWAVNNDMPRLHMFLDEYFLRRDLVRRINNSKLRRIIAGSPYYDAKVSVTFSMK